MSEYQVAIITITRTLIDNRDVIAVTASDAADEELALVEVLGMLRFAEDSVIRDRMGETS